MATLVGRTALVTGASRGIGRAVAIRLAREGASVAIGYREQDTAAERVAAEIMALGGRAVAIAADVADPAACQELVAQASERLGSLDILVHNAGTALYRLLLDTSVEEWDYLSAVHLRAAFVLSRAVLPGMIHRHWGRIIAISSIWGLTGAANEVAYSAVKAGQIGLVRALAKEVARGGITVNAVAPGAVETEMLDSLTDADVEEFAESIPAGRLGTPGEVAAVVAFLASPEASYLSGQVVSPNGAYLT